MSISGSIGKFVVDNSAFNVTNDADVTRTLGKYEKEGQATSGDPNIKFIKRVEIAEGFDLQMDGADRELLRDILNDINPVDVSYTTAKGDNYTCSGHLTSTGDATQDAKITLTVIPAKATGWTATVV